MKIAILTEIYRTYFQTDKKDLKMGIKFIMIQNRYEFVPACFRYVCAVMEV